LTGPNETVSSSAADGAGDGGAAEGNVGEGFDWEGWPRVRRLGVLFELPLRRDEEGWGTTRVLVEDVAEFIGLEYGGLGRNDPSSGTSLSLREMLMAVTVVEGDEQHSHIFGNSSQYTLFFYSRQAAYDRCDLLQHCSLCTRRDIPLVRRAKHTDGSKAPKLNCRRLV